MNLVILVILLSLWGAVAQPVNSRGATTEKNFENFKDCMDNETQNEKVQENKDCTSGYAYGIYVCCVIICVLVFCICCCKS